MAGSPSEPVESSPLLETKFYAPRRRPGSVARPRLLARLDRGTQSKLTLVSAPAGFGKTTLLAEWLASVDGRVRSVAWLSLDRGDSQTSSFWIYFVTALQQVRPSVADAALALLQSSQSVGIEQLLGGLVNELAAQPDEFTVVLEDYHLVENRGVHEGIAFLLDHLPPHTHLIITSRADPPLPLARLRARGELTEVRAADLRFTVDEATAFLNDAMELALSSEEVARLDSRAEGWIAGLQLAALSLQGREDAGKFIAEFTGDDRYIVDYLVEEVLERQSPDLRRFLLQTSILERLNGPLCDAVTGSQDGVATLEHLERGNLFVVPLDDRREWYRYHHLFADVLRAHLLHERGAELPVLHGRAARWFEQHAMPERAIDHASAAGDHEEVARMLVAAFARLSRSGSFRSMLGWLASLPPDMIRERPRLAFIYARSAIASQNTNEMARKYTGWAEEAIQRIKAQGGLDASADIGGTFVGPDGISILEGEVLTLKLMHSSRHLAREERARLATEALELLPPGSREHLRRMLQATAARGDGASVDQTDDDDLDQAVEEARRSENLIHLATNLTKRGEADQMKGRLFEAERAFEEALRVVPGFSMEMGWLACKPHASLAEILLEQGDVNGARSHAARAVEIAEVSPMRSYALYAWAAASQVFLAAGELELGTAHLRRAEEFVRGSRDDRFTSFLSATQLAFFCQSGDLEAASAVALARGLTMNTSVTRDNDLEMTAFARYLIACEEPAAADDLIERVIAVTRDEGHISQEVRALAVRALTREALGDRARALDSLALATRLGEPGGFVRTFADEGMAELLRTLIEVVGEGGGAPAGSLSYLRALVAGPMGVSLDAVPSEKRTPAVRERLTPRELEIIGLVAAGMRNQEIAEHLVLSVATVKRHIANVYDKLDVTHRTEAVARAKALNLL